MKEEKSTGRAVLAVAVSYAVWVLIGFVYSFLTTVVALVYLPGSDVLHDNGILIFLVSWVVSFAVVYGNYRLALYLMGKIGKTPQTTALSYQIFGWLLVVFNCVAAFRSIFSGSPIRILGFIFAYCFIRRAKKMMSPEQPTTDTASVG